MRPTRIVTFRAAVLLAASVATGCSGNGGQGNVLMPAGGSGALGGAGSTVVRIFVPAGLTTSSGTRQPALPAPPTPPISGAAPGASTNVQAPITTPAPPVAPTAAPAPGSQSLAINVSGPTNISQNVSVGPNSSGCSPAPGGSNCQLALSLPAGNYVGTVGSATIAFTVTTAANNALNLTLGGVPSQLAVVPASYTSVQNAQGTIDLYGAGRHAFVVEMLDANQNVMVGGAGVTFSLAQGGGSLPLTISPVSSAASNLFYVTPSSAASGASAILRATANFGGFANPCAQSGAVCSGTARIEYRADSRAWPIRVRTRSRSMPRAKAHRWRRFRAASRTRKRSPSTATAISSSQTSPEASRCTRRPTIKAPVTIASGINHPQSLAVDARGDVFVANGNGSNTVTLYSPPYAGPPAATIAAGVNDPVALAVDSAMPISSSSTPRRTTVTEYASPYTGAPVTISKGLNAPNSLALDTRGNLFVANLNSTPNSVVEFLPPFSNATAPVATITNGVNEQGSIAVMSSNLFVPNQGANTVTEYAAPYNGTPVTINGGQSQPVALAVDSSGNLYVANYGNNTVTVYGTPYASGSWATISNGVAAPMGLALSPPTSGGPALFLALSRAHAQFVAVER